MISIYSLAEQLLPNIYVKNISLDTNYKTSYKATKQSEYFQNFDVKKVSVPTDSITSRIRLSAKFLESNSAQSELLKFFDSEILEEYNIYVHQITNKGLYQALVSPSNPPGSIEAAYSKVFPFGQIPGLDSKVVSFKESFSDSKQDLPPGAGGIVNSNTTQLPTEILDDGTVLNEIIMNVEFNSVPKNTDFLAYLIISSISIETEFGSKVTSPARKEIVILDGQLQNQGLMFTIAPFPAGADVEALSRFGNPGDTWAGGVHVHEGRFMAGAVHKPEPHPFLDYSIVPIRKFFDNRIKDEIEKSVLNLTSTFESLIPNTTKYKTNTSNILDFKNNKKFGLISDIYLSQDMKGNVHGAFVVNKYDIIKNNSAFFFLFDNADQSLNEADKKIFINNIMGLSILKNCYVYNDNELLGTMTEDLDELNFEKSMIKGDLRASSTLAVNIQKDTFTIPNNTVNFENFLFKHHISDGQNTTQKYSVKIEYTDPTIIFMKNLYSKLNSFKGDMDTLMNILSKGVNDKSAYDYTTEKIKAQTIVKLTEMGMVENGNFNELFLKGVLDLPYEDIFVAFYKKGTSSNTSEFLTSFDISNYIKTSANLKTTTATGLLSLNQFLNNLLSKVYNILNTFGAKQPKTTKGSGYIDSVSKGNVKSTLGEKVITVETSFNNSLQSGAPLNQIKISDSGYDFTGAIDKIQNAIGRQKQKFLNIRSSDYTRIALLNLTQIANASVSNINTAVNNSVTIIDSNDETFDFTISDSYYAYLNIYPSSTDILKSSVLLPKTVLNMNSDEISSQNILTAVMKKKLNILEDNTKGKLGTNNLATCLKEDLISLLVYEGLSIPIVGENQQSKAIEASFFSTPSAPKQVNIDLSQDKPLFLGPDLANELSTQKGNKFKVTPSYTQQLDVKTLGSVENNNLLNSLFTRRHFTNVKNNFSFKIKNITLPVEILTQKSILPLQVLCLSSETANAQGQFIFKNFFSDNQGYIKNGVINPSRLSEYWFGHQNIAKVEYLSGFTETIQDISVKDNTGTGAVLDAAPQPKKISYVNVKKPQWKLLAPAVVDGLQLGQKILCRVSMYEQVSINKYLLKSFGMPLINSYFTIEGSGVAESAADFGFGPIDTDGPNIDSLADVPGGLIQATTENTIQPTEAEAGATETAQGQVNQNTLNVSPVANTVGGNIFSPEQAPPIPGIDGFPF
tara:strand:- start:625 stop:4194 length:3570 start_codon:yes stop_codon:yes gene_type:complete